jgi:uncharacterized phosphosugar-binding protein
MAYNKANLSVLAYANGFTMWHYITTDAQTVVRVVDYFLPAINQIRVNDMILVVSASGGTPAPFWAHCNANTGATIDIVDGLAVATTDTD